MHLPLPAEGTVRGSSSATQLPLPQLRKCSVPAGVFSTALSGNQATPVPVGPLAARTPSSLLSWTNSAPSWASCHHPRCWPEDWAEQKPRPPLRVHSICP